MSGQVSFGGNLVIGQVGVCEGAGFPAAVFSIPVQLGGGAGCAGSKPASVKTYGTSQVNSPVAFVTLPGVGAGQPVTKGNFLYLRTAVKMDIRLTMVGTPDTVSVLNVQGILVMEFPDANTLKLLEAQGVGTIEYAVTGNE